VRIKLGSTGPAERAYVYLNGEMVTNAVEADDSEGWVDVREIPFGSREYLLHPKREKAELRRKFGTVKFTLHRLEDEFNPEQIAAFLTHGEDGLAFNPFQRRALANSTLATSGNRMLLVIPDTMQVFEADWILSPNLVTGTDMAEPGSDSTVEIAFDESGFVESVTEQVNTYLSEHPEGYAVPVDPGPDNSPEALAAREELNQFRPQAIPNAGPQCVPIPFTEERFPVGPDELSGVARVGIPKPVGGPKTVLDLEQVSMIPLCQLNTGCFLKHGHAGECYVGTETEE
jgi:hypothetical protein